MVDQLRELWNFSDLDATDQRFRALLEGTIDQSRRAEIFTQLARVQGLRGDFEAGHHLLDKAEALAGADLTAGVRTLLERGRLYRSSGRPAEARTMFISAFELAQDHGNDYLAVDAAHMAALVDTPWPRRYGH